MTELGFCYFAALIEALQLIEDEHAPYLHRRAELFELRRYVREKGEQIAFKRFGRIPSPAPAEEKNGEVIVDGLRPYIRMQPPIKCNDPEGCDRPSDAKGLCRMHYGRRYCCRNSALTIP